MDLYNIPLLIKKTELNALDAIIFYCRADFSIKIVYFSVYKNYKAILPDFRLCPNNNKS